MSRTSGIFLLAAGVMAGVATAARGFAGEDDRCTIATKGDSPVAQACAQGGVKAAKAKMKELTRTAKDNGVKFDCEDCHKDTDEFELRSDARDKFQKLLAAQSKSAAPPSHVR